MNSLRKWGDASHSCSGRRSHRPLPEASYTSSNKWLGDASGRRQKLNVCVREAAADSPPQGTAATSSSAEAGSQSGHRCSTTSWTRHRLTRLTHREKTALPDSACGTSERLTQVEAEGLTSHRRRETADCTIQAASARTPG